MNKPGYYIVTANHVPKAAKKVSAPFFFECMMNQTVQDLDMMVFINNFFSTLDHFDKDQVIDLKRTLKRRAELIRLRQIFIVVETVHPTYSKVVEAGKEYALKPFFGSCMALDDDQADVFYSPVALSG